MRSFLLDLTATAFVADYFLVEIHADGRVTGYVVMGAGRHSSEDAVAIDEYTLFAARENWKQFARGGGVQADPDNDKFLLAWEDALCHGGKCGRYVCTEGRSLDEWSEPEPTHWEYVSEAFGDAR